MPEEKPDETSTEEKPGETPPGQKPDEEQKPDDKAGAGGTSTSSEDELPDWARKKLAKVRGEAAGYRTRLRDAETKLSEAKTPDEVEAALADVKAKNVDLERSLLVSTVARKFDLPEALAGRLRGDIPDELEADAKALQAFVTPAPPPALGGGLNPSDNDDGEMDPRKLARRTRRF
ncbi:hypothetical protein ACKI1I_06895 [Streptomyces turgidiscabies]|uniref:Scaffolding protein n=1 Tax=Streptomyces turgidiscabies (strain Car8) TaxID=698760 RepID=L7F212_STRT8|nr:MULTISPECIES: hypothetical protein [Streptomyces]ELP64625.1 hypothetical protein STRTUCAR8_09217 [Streptomyces turgidiscabies Car8]MDX3491544.1 hypothetical protein [Streptomyces turgidiscabies]GAQ73150.1 hypothetical protein T45_04906 [Streptomyces turgidiscabies]